MLFTSVHSLKNRRNPELLKNNSIRNIDIYVIMTKNIFQIKFIFSSLIVSVDLKYKKAHRRLLEKYL